MTSICSIGSNVEICNSRVPTDTGKTGKPGKMRQLFPVREKSGNFEKNIKKSGKSQGILSESGKSQEKL